MPQASSPSAMLPTGIGCTVTPAQVVLCLLNLKLVRLAHDPKHMDSTADVIGYAALLPQVAP
jgi:hypothetical protein